MEPRYRSDHSTITLCITFNDVKKCKGLLKFNKSLLYEEEFLNSLNGYRIDREVH